MYSFVQICSLFIGVFLTMLNIYDEAYFSKAN